MSSSTVLKAMAKSFKKGGIQAAYNFPGFNSHILFDCLGGTITSTNEKIAYELAWGSSQAGRPALVTFKNVGLNDAADPFINSVLTGVGAGLVLAVFDDIELEGSQCILDSRHYFGFYGGLWLEPFDFASTTVLAEAAPQLSRIFDLPVVMRLTNRAMRFDSRDAQSFVAVDRIVKLAEACASKQSPVVAQVEPVVHPLNGNAQRKQVATKNATIQRFTNELHRLINHGGVTGEVYCGHSDSVADSHIVTLPVPTTDVGIVEVMHEVGDPVVANQLALQVKTASAKFTSDNVGYDPGNAEHYIVTAQYERLFRLLQPRYELIAGDLGVYTKDTLHILTHCLSFGSAVAVAIGMRETGKNALAITGDGSFYHSGKNAITEASLREVASKIVLIDNGGSQGTGGQNIPGDMPNNIEVMSIDFDTIDDSELERMVSIFVASPGSTILKINHEV